MNQKLSINQWKESDRPREKLMNTGAESLSDAELLAILIGSGTPQLSAVALMQEILNDCNNNLHTLGKLSYHQLMNYKGIGEAKAVTIVAACELGRRRRKSQREERPLLRSSEDIYNYLSDSMRDLDVEEAHALFLNQRLEVIKPIKLSHGGITETAIDIRVILKEALLCNATNIAIAHNHPSNNCTPSRGDDLITQTLKEACKTLRLNLIDHIIVCDGTYYSYADEGRL